MPRRRANKWKRGFNNSQSDKTVLCAPASGLAASIRTHLTADKTERLAHLRLASHSTMASVTKPTLGLHYTNVTPHPAEIPGTSKPRPVLLFILSISEPGLEETEETVLRCVFLRSTSPENTLLLPAAVLFFPSCVLFGVKLLFLLLRTARASWSERRHNPFCLLNGREGGSPSNESNHQALSQWLLGRPN